MACPAQPHGLPARSNAVAAVGFWQDSLPLVVFAGEARVMSAVSASARARSVDRPLLGHTLQGALGPSVAEGVEAQVSSVLRTGEPCARRAKPTPATRRDGSV